jgi:TolB-like protein/AraC-like DNA-binding protein
MNEPLSMDQEFISNLTNIVIANLKDENFGVENLAEESGISRITIYRKLKSIRNQDVSQFIREIRLQRAMRLLQNNVGTASGIAYMVGFGSPAYFNKCFHEYYGYPPGQAKKEALRKTEKKFMGWTTRLPFKKKKTVGIFIIASSVLLFLTLVFAGFKLFYGNSPRKDFTGREKSIAVLPFQNLSDTVANQYFIDGIMEDILDNLQKIEDFRVLSRTSTDQFKSQERPTIPEIATKLNVNYIVEGSGQRYGNSFRLRVRLIDAGDREIWTHSYEEKIQVTSDIFNIQNQIASAIASELNATITPEEKKLIEKVPTASLTAYDFYLRGRAEDVKYILNNPYTSNLLNTPPKWQGLERAERMYKTALLYDSAYAKAYIGLAIVYLNEHYFEEYFSGSFLDSILILADQALAIDDQLAEAHTIKGLYYAEKGDYKRSLSEYDRSSRLNPNDWVPFYGKAQLYLNQSYYLEMIQNLLKAASLNHGSALPGLLREISIEFASNGFKEQANRYNLDALKLDGDSVRYYSLLALVEEGLQNWENAIVLLKKAYVIDSTDLSILSDLGYYCGWGKRNEESLTFFKKYINRAKTLGISDLNDLNRMHRIGYAYWANGFKREAESYFDKQIEYCQKQIKLDRPYASQLFFTYYDLAAIYALRGEREKAYKNLLIFNRGKRYHAAWDSFLSCDPLFEKVKDDPAFQKIESEVENKAQAEHDRIKKWLDENRAP